MDDEKIDGETYANVRGSLLSSEGEEPPAENG